MTLIVKSVYGARPDYLKLKELDPAFCEKHSKEQVQKSCHYMLGKSAILVMSKQTEAQMKPILKKENDYITGKQIPLIEQDPIQVERKVSTYDGLVNIFPSVKVTGSAVTFMLLCVLNWVNVGYIVNDDNISIQRADLDKSAADNGLKFIQSRLKSILSVDYSYKTPAFRKKTPKDAYDEKVDLKKVKDALAVLQLIYSFGVVRIQDRKELYDSLMKATTRDGHNRDQNRMVVVKDELTKMLKLKK